MNTRPDRKPMRQTEVSDSRPSRVVHEFLSCCLLLEAWQRTNQLLLPFRCRQLKASGATGRYRMRGPAHVCRSSSAGGLPVCVPRDGAAGWEHGHRLEPSAHSLPRPKQPRKPPPQRHYSSTIRYHQTLTRWKCDSQALRLGLPQIDKLLRPFQFQRCGIDTEAIAPTA